MASPFDRVWTRQPSSVVRLNPAIQGLAWVLSPHLGGSGMEVSAGTIGLAGSTAKINTYGHSRVFDLTAAADGTCYYEFADSPTAHLSGGAFTIGALVYLRSGGDSFRVSKCVSNGATTAEFDFDCAPGGGSTAMTLGVTGGGSYRVYASAATIPTDTWCVVHVTVPATIQTAPAFYVNAVLQPAATEPFGGSGSGAGDSSTKPIRINRRDDNAGNEFSRCAATWGIRRAILLAEIRSQVANPWQLFAPLRRPIFVPGAAGGSSSSITAAAAASSTSTLTGSSTNAATVTGASGASATSTITGRSTNAATVTGAAGVASTSTLTGRSTNSATLTGAAGASTTGTLVGSAGSTNSVISDISGGWTPSSGSDNWAMVDEVSFSDADYTTSPDLTTPEVFGITARAAGTWDINYRALRTGSTGDVRMVLRDSGGSVVGTGTWQTMLASFASYTDTITTSGVAEQLEVEIRA